MDEDDLLIAMLELRTGEQLDAITREAVKAIAARMRADTDVLLDSLPPLPDRR